MESYRTKNKTDLGIEYHGDKGYTPKYLARKYDISVDNAKRLIAAFGNNRHTLNDAARRLKRYGRVTVPAKPQLPGFTE